MNKVLNRAIFERVSGNRPSPPRAAGAALVVGGAASALTYRLLRHERKE